MLTSSWNNIGEPIFERMCELFDKIWTEHIKPLVANFLDFVGELAAGALDIYNKFICPVVKGLTEIFGPFFAAVFDEICDKVEIVIGAIIDSVNGVITALKGVVQFISGVFTGDWKKAWEGIKTIFKGIWESISAIVKAPINLIIDTVNKMTEAIESAINWIIDGINELSFDVPDWVPGIGGETFGFDLDKIDIPQIPKLATGTVVPANYGEFLAVLGDNKRETEVVSPLSTIKQAVREAMGENRAGAKQPVVLKLVIKGKELAEVLIDDINDLTSSSGECPIKI